MPNITLKQAAIGLIAAAGVVAVVTAVKKVKTLITVTEDKKKPLFEAEMESELDKHTHEAECCDEGECECACDCVATCRDC